MQKSVQTLSLKVLKEREREREGKVERISK